MKILTPVLHSNNTPLDIKQISKIQHLVKPKQRFDTKLVPERFLNMVSARKSLPEIKYRSHN